MLQDEKIRLIKNTVYETCRKVELDNAMDGGHFSPNSHHYKQKLEYFLDGVEFQKTGESKMYSHIIEKAILEKDEEYQLFLKLKQKFEKSS